MDDINRLTVVNLLTVVLLSENFIVADEVLMLVKNEDGSVLDLSEPRLFLCNGDSSGSQNNDSNTAQ